MKIVLGKKLHMTREFLGDGAAVPVTALDVSSCVVTQLRTVAEGGTEVQLGIDKVKRLGKARAGHLKGMTMVRSLRSFRLSQEDSVTYERGKEISAGLFAPGEVVTVVGVSKGKGFAGVMKRHGFKGHPATHGHKDSHRAPGSIGAGGVQRVMKGRRMAGRMGGTHVTVKGLEVIKVEEEKGIVYVKGAVPGARNSVVIIKSEK